MKTDLTAPHFTNEEAARAHYEATRWPNGPHCPRSDCGSFNAVLMQGKTTRSGLYNCRDCRKPFTATMGTIYEKSHIPLHKWLLATHILCASKKGVGAYQLWRMLGFGSYKTAWFMAHRIREAMRSDAPLSFGSTGGAVESDETFFGQNPNVPVSRMAIRSMNAILTVVDRESGQARSVVIDAVNATEIGAILRENLAKEAHLMTDDGRHYKPLAKDFAAHGVVNHSADEYVSRDDPNVHTQTVENYYSVFKRGMKGVYQHCSRRHLHRYCAEFDFRYSNRIKLGVDDNMRAEKALKGTVGRRLTYRPLAGQSA